VEAKYVRQLFAKEAIRKRVLHDLATGWYFLDEVTREATRVRGPYRRQAIKKFLDEGQLLFRDGYVWHPCMGSKWMPVDKTYDIIFPPPSLSDERLQDAFMRKLQLQSYPHPHLKGPLDVSIKAQASKKWVVILDRTLAIYAGPISNAPEAQVNIEEIADISLVEQPERICIKIEDHAESILLSSAKTDEVMEWFHALGCCRHLILALGAEFGRLDYDASELHICNVKASDEFVGDKIHEGTLKKQGQKWKVTRTRHFILRSTALFYYKSRNEKLCKRFFKLMAGTKIDKVEEYKQSNHFSLTNPDRVLHMWADTQAEKDVWVEKLAGAIEALRCSEAEMNTHTW
jgi:hypothetical protein